MKTLVPGIIIIAIDFDGMMTTEGALGHKLQLRENCKAVLKKWASNPKVRLILWTCRTGEALSECIEFLKQEGMMDFFDAVNCQIMEVAELFMPYIGPKVGADKYLDDKNFLALTDWRIIDLMMDKELNQLG